MRYCHYYKSPIGNLRLSSDGEYLLELSLYDGEISNSDSLEIFNLIEKYLNEYFSGGKPDINFPIKLDVSPFQNIVLETLLSIGYGEVISYGELAKIVAKKMGKEKMSAQAVGNALSINPIPIIVPCHRVIGSNNHRGGFSWGISKKMYLLELEKYPIQTLK